ncbi:unnamed protein product [Phyllotreta striolata]|uniref:Transposase n=1 Tax=Phyllotreta striolata TaxID=444603 RepID=A0A9N9TJI4_PHYSR|nr:unnamed protein product [Phyllotreta striolata]
MELPQGDPLTVIQWLAKRRLLANSRECEVCHIPMSRVKKNGVDGFAWRCRICDTRVTIRRGSFLHDSHLKLSQMLVILHEWSMDQSQEDIARVARINQTQKVVDWSNFCRAVCRRFNDAVPQKLWRLTSRTSLNGSTTGEQCAPGVGCLVE